MTVGVKVSAVVYDLLPVKWPQFFPDEAEEAHRQWLGIVASADQALCISRSVAADLREFVEREHPEGKVEIAHFPLGNELDQRTGGSGPSRRSQRR